MNRRRSSPLLLLLLLALLAVPGPGCGDAKDEEGADDLDGEVEAHPTATLGPTIIRFTDVSAKSGIDIPNHTGRSGIKEYMIEACGIGPAWFDYDQDGYLDVFIPDADVPSNYRLIHDRNPKTGRQQPYMLKRDDAEERFLDQLWRNNGDGTFTNVAAAAGIVDDAWSFGATAVDYDGDGWTDIFVANFGFDRLWHNNGDGTFTDVAERLGLQGGITTWSNCAAAGDVDEDGRLDLYVTAFADPSVEVERMRLDRNLPLGTPIAEISGRSCKWKGMQVYCGPRGLAELDDTFFSQGEDGVFVDKTKAYGLIPRKAEYGFTALMFDIDDDGLLDIYLANDSVPNFLWQQQHTRDGSVKFAETSDSLGCKYGFNQLAQASMGATAGDFNQDGAFDLYVTNFAHDYNNVFLGKRVPGQETYYFKDRGLALMGTEVYYDLSWGCGYWDYDNDGDLDLYVANGHVYKEIDLFEKTGSVYGMLNALFECFDASQPAYREVGTKAQLHPPVGVNPANLEAGNGMAVPKCSRAAAFADYDNDGRLDVLVCNMNETPTLLRNTTPHSPDRNWIKFVLRQPGGNPNALGATVEVVTDAGTQRFPISILNKSSFLSTHDPRLHVGLGKATHCKVRVIWPGRARETSTWERVEAGHLWRLHREGDKVEEVALRPFKDGR